MPIKVYQNLWRTLYVKLDDFEAAAYMGWARAVLTDINWALIDYRLMEFERNLRGTAILTTWPHLIFRGQTAHFPSKCFWWVTGGSYAICTRSLGEIWGVGILMNWPHLPLKVKPFTDRQNSFAWVIGSSYAICTRSLAVIWGVVDLCWMWISNPCQLYPRASSSRRCTEAGQGAGGGQ